MKDYSYDEKIWVQFTRYDNDNAYGFYAHVKCSVCGKWTIDILPEGERNLESKNQKDWRDHRPLNKILNLLVPILNHPICDKCDYGIKQAESRKALPMEDAKL